MTIPKMPFTFHDFVKYPLQALLFLLLIYFAYKEFSRGDECRDLRNIIASQDARITKLEVDKDQLVNALLVKNGIIDAIIKSTDSLARQKVGNQAKNILNKTK